MRNFGRDLFCKPARRRRSGRRGLRAPFRRGLRRRGPRSGHKLDLLPRRGHRHELPQPHHQHPHLRLRARKGAQKCAAFSRRRPGLGPHSLLQALPRRRRRLPRPAPASELQQPPGGRVARDLREDLQGPHRPGPAVRHGGPHLPAGSGSTRPSPASWPSRPSREGRSAYPKRAPPSGSAIARGRPRRS